MKWPWDQSEFRAELHALRMELERHRAEAAHEAVFQRQAEAEQRAREAMANRLQPGDIIARCLNPDCPAPDRPKKVMCELHDVVNRGNEMLALSGGFRLACQPCGHVFSADRLGVYRQHPSALPFMPTLSQAPPKEAGEKRDGGPPVRGLPPAREPLMP